MISAPTQQQLATLTLAPEKPLVICDVDDVVVHFLRGFDAYLARIDHVLEANSFALGGNVLHAQTRAPMADETVSALVDRFFVEQTEHLEAIDDAVASLQALSDQASVVMLTNLPHHARDQRIRNLAGHGLNFPVVTNSGPKGPAIRHLASLTRAAVVFVDDSPGFVRSSFEHAPDVHIIHFLHDQRFARLHQPFDFVSLTTDKWTKAAPHIARLLET
jgi:hypothetical protein